MKKRNSLNEVKLQLRKSNKYKQYKDHNQNQVDSSISSMPLQMSQSNPQQQYAFSNIPEFISLFQKLSQLTNFIKSFIIQRSEGGYRFNAVRHLDDVVRSMNEITAIIKYLEEHLPELLKYLAKDQIPQLKLLKHAIELYIQNWNELFTYVNPKIELNFYLETFNNDGTTSQQKIFTKHLIYNNKTASILDGKYYFSEDELQNFGINNQIQPNQRITYFYKLIYDGFDFAKKTTQTTISDSYFFYYFKKIIENFNLKIAQILQSLENYVSKQGGRRFRKK